jgi:hypothetical protein
LFQTVLVAIADMLTNKTITNKWKEESDKLSLGEGITLGGLKKLLSSNEKAFIDGEELSSKLEILAKDGLTKEFIDLYMQVRELDVSTTDNNVAEILDMYVGKHLSQTGKSLKTAIEQTISVLSLTLKNALTEVQKTSASEPAVEHYERYREKLKKVPPLVDAITKKTNSLYEVRVRITLDEMDRYYKYAILDASNNNKHNLHIQTNC